MIVALVFFTLSLSINTLSGSADNAARKMGRMIEKRMKTLDGFALAALQSDHSQWLEIKDLPEDMVIYRYVYDTLQSWCNRFPVWNDDISSRIVFQRLPNYRSNMSSPLREVGEKVKYVSLGPKWYMIKALSDGSGCKVIAGLEINNTLLDNLNKNYNGVNSHLKLPGKFHVHPLNYSGGSPVPFNGEDVFKVIAETGSDTPFLANSILRWLALLFALMASFIALIKRRSPKVYLMNMAVICVSAAISYVWGIQLQDSTDFFAPTVFAGERVFYSFGILLLVNLAIFLLISSSFLMRNVVLYKIVKSGTGPWLAVRSVFISIALTALAVYIHSTLKSLIVNSNISLDLYLWQRLTIYSLLAYVSYVSLMIGGLMLVQMLMPARHLFNIKGVNIFTKRIIVIYALLCTVYFTAVTDIFGFEKERDRVMVTANRMAIDRDLRLELSLLNIEASIAGDRYISALAAMEGSGNMIVNRLTDNYMGVIQRSHNINVTLSRANDRRGSEYIDNVIRSGSPIDGHSHFVYIYDADGNSEYAGSFFYYDKDAGLTRMLIEIIPKTEISTQGYYSLLGQYSNHGAARLPALYSYAKYISGTLVSFKGDYAYPTVMSDTRKRSDDHVYRVNGFVHFANEISESEVIVVSRPVKTPLASFVTFSYMFLLMYLLMYLFSSKKRDRNAVIKRYYFRARINALMSLFLFLSLVVITVLSIVFVYRRNEVNNQKLMASKINTIQSMLAYECGGAESWRDINTAGFANVLKGISNSTESDITLYTPAGKVFKSTTPEIFERMIVGARINQDAYNYIVYKNHRFYIHDEKLDGHRYSACYAPVFNSRGAMIAIINAPNNAQNYNFRNEAMFHAATIANIVLILLVVTMLLSRTVINAMFRPLVEIGNKMSNTRIHDLQYIIYKRNDELSTIIDAYNIMVHDLSESARQMTMMEREKAWSEMARQVAHEIKNPLTPIKLEIQRLIRLKGKNDPSWSEKFDAVASIILEHIDILTDTANEFSTFAKLYSEKQVVMDLDRTIQDQMAIFDNRENILITYIGLSGATVLAPKPQLIRVFVNLLTNAIQAVEIKQAEEGKDYQGKIAISLRNSTKEGYYDIVFDDNGPGVSDDNLDKLFTPNFTTKNGGTGLGLAICRSIIEKCNGEILYHRSQMLKGASFTVRLPKETALPEDQ